MECEVCPEYEECDECEDPKDCQITEGEAMLAVDNKVYEIDEVGDDNETEVTFDYWVYNYGDGDAGDIEVRCKLSDDGGEVVVSEKDSFGSLDSESKQSGDLTVEDLSLDIDEEYSANCYVEDCSNCDILYKRIDDLVEIYEED